MYQFESKIQQQLLVFLESQDRALWIGKSSMKVYVTKTYRFYAPEDKDMDISTIFSKNIFNCIDIASIEVGKKYQRKGCLKRFIEYVENANLSKYVYIESVMSDIVFAYCERRQYIVEAVYPPAFHKRIRNKLLTPTRRGNPGCRYNSYTEYKLLTPTRRGNPYTESALRWLVFLLTPTRRGNPLTQ